MNHPAPISRRRFLGTAGAAALALAAGPAGYAAAAPAGDSPNASPEGTTIPSATSITDNGGDVWTVSSGVIYRNGTTVGETYNVSVLLWYGGRVYHCGTGGQWYVCFNSTWLKVTDPRIPLAAPTGLMYGVNGHYDTQLSPATIATRMSELGATVFRVNTGGDASTIARAASIANYLNGAGKHTFPVIDAGLRDGNGALAYGNESDAYNAARATATQVAQAFAPYGVTMYECGNELTRDPYIILPAHEADAGTKIVDFNNTNWPMLRGFVKGLIDGIKTVQPLAACGVNFCKSDVAAADALWDGMQPDGSGGYPQIRWDLTTWHNYEGDGDIFHIGTDGAGPSFNLPVYVKARFGKPFLMTEWNSDPNQGTTHRAAYIQSQLAEFRSHRQTEGFRSSMIYELDGGTEWGLTESDGTPLNPPFTAFQSFVAANPDA